MSIDKTKRILKAIERYIATNATVSAMVNQISDIDTILSQIDSSATTPRKDNSLLAVFVPQAQGAILDANKFGYGKLGTYGASTCCILR